MPNYVAQSPGVRSAPPPVVDVGDIINQASRAFQANKDGIMTRAILQQRAQQAKDANARQQAQADLERQRFDLAQRQQQNDEQLHVATLMGQGYDPVDPSAPPTTSTGAPQHEVQIGERTYRLNPANTPDAKKKAERRAKLDAYNAGLQPNDPHRLAPNDLDLVASTDALFNQFTERRLGLVNDPVATHQAQRDYDIKHPLPTKGGDPDGKAAADLTKRRDAFLLQRVGVLTKPSKGLAGMPKPGLTSDAALEQATHEWNLVHGDDAPIAPTPHAHDTPGDINLGNDKDVSQGEYDTLAAQYKAALARGVDPSAARQMYDELVMAVAKKYGQVK